MICNDSVLYELIAFILLACVPAHSSVLTSQCCIKIIIIFYGNGPEIHGGRLVLASVTTVDQAGPSIITSDSPNTRQAPTKETLK
jgi:hypothetical protein